MPWLQLHIPASGDHAEAVQRALESIGANAVTLTDAGDQPLLEPMPGTTPLWRDSIVTALFEAGRDREQLLRELETALGSKPGNYRFEELADQAWERAWMDGFAPMRFGRRLWIVPSWSETPDADAVNLRLDPGLAFGTGTHETTALCLEWLDGAALAGKTVLDYGCGSGVLGIAALLLGAGNVIACDLDPQALEATRANARTNGVDGHLRCCLPESLQHTPVDVILANILAAPLVELAPKLSAFAGPGTEIVLSGILAEQAQEVLDAYALWFYMEPPEQRGDWILLTGQRRPDGV